MKKTSQKALDALAAGRLKRAANLQAKRENLVQESWNQNKTNILKHFHESMDEEYQKEFGMLPKDDYIEAQFKKAIQRTLTNKEITSPTMSDYKAAIETITNSNLFNKYDKIANKYGSYALKAVKNYGTRSDWQKLVWAARKAGVDFDPNDVRYEGTEIDAQGVAIAVYEFHGRFIRIAQSGKGGNAIEIA